MERKKDSVKTDPKVTVRLTLGHRPPLFKQDLDHVELVLELESRFGIRSRQGFSAFTVLVG
jgi:hypothetical protein